MAGPDNPPGGLLLLLTGPMQSWGERSAFGNRDTAAFPTRSGVIGVLASALGLPRGADLTLFDPLTVTVRADRPGVPLADFQTVGTADPHGIARAAGGTRDGIIGHRHYLADAAFTVAVDAPAEHRPTLARIADALDRPHWPPYLGRRGCPPALPVLLARTDKPAEPLLDTLPALARRPRDDRTVTVTIVREAADPARAHSTVNDRPVSFAARNRAYTPRTVALDPADVPAAGTGLAGYTTLLAAARTHTPLPRQDAR